MTIIATGPDLAKNVFAVHGFGSSAGALSESGACQVECLDRDAAARREWHGSLEQQAAQQLIQLNCVGEMTATAVVAMVGNASEFNCGRQFSAWIDQSFNMNTRVVRHHGYDLHCSGMADDRGGFVPKLIAVKASWPSRPRTIAMAPGAFPSEQLAADAAHAQGVVWVAHYG